MQKDTRSQKGSQEISHSCHGHHRGQHFHGLSQSVRHPEGQFTVNRGPWRECKLASEGVRRRRLDPFSRLRLHSFTARYAAFRLRTASSWRYSFSVRGSCPSRHLRTVAFPPRNPYWLYSAYMRLSPARTGPSGIPAWSAQRSKGSSPASMCSSSASLINAASSERLNMPGAQSSKVPLSNLVVTKASAAISA